MSQKSSTFAIVIRIERHIEILLLSNDCVIVPGLGGFMTHYVEAHYDENEAVFLPPQRTLGFNPQLKLNDSLLVQSYIEAYDISYPEALNRIEDEVYELCQHIQNEGYYELNNIGRLSMNDEGKMEFEPCEAGILTPGLYGLGLFEMNMLNAAPVKTTIAAVAETTDQDLQEEENSAVAEKDDEEKEDGAIIIKMSWVRNAVAIAAAIACFFLLATPVANSDLGNKAMSQLQGNIIYKLMPKDSNMAPAQPVEVKEVREVKEVKEVMAWEI